VLSISLCFAAFICWLAAWDADYCYRCVQCLSVICLSSGSTRLHCATVAERIKILFGVNTLRGPWNIVLHEGPDPPPHSKRGVGENFVNYGHTAYLGNGWSMCSACSAFNASFAKLLWPLVKLCTALIHKNADNRPKRQKCCPLVK